MEARLYAFGSNGSGQLGLGHTEDLSAPATFATDGPQFASRGIKSVRGGGNHTLALTQDAHVFAAGDLTSSGLTIKSGGEHNNDEEGEGWRPVPLSAIAEEQTDSRFAFATATWEASIFVTQNGNTVYACGSGNKGELGLGEGVASSPCATKITGFPPVGLKIIDIASCMAHTVAVLSNGEVWGWGAGRKGQLGSPAQSVWRPRKIDGVPFKVVKVACGREFTILAAAPEDGSFAVLGPDKYDVQSSAPLSISGWKHIEASWSGVYVLLQDGRLVSWGRSDRGQIQNGLPLLERIAAGSEHVLGQTTDGNLLAWGWGEHGNCGTGATMSKPSAIMRSRECSFVGAGCATSFFVGP